MNAMPPQNEGDRPSLLLLGQLAAGELSDATARDLRAGLDEASRAKLSAIEASKHAMPPLDLRALRARAERLPPEIPLPANNTRGFPAMRAWMPLLAIAASLLLALFVIRTPDDAPDIRPKTGEVLDVSYLGPNGALPYVPGTKVGENDILGFRVAGPGHRGVVLLSVDGNGTLSVFYPKSGDAPESIASDGLVELPGSVILDGAPGPEIFLAVFDRSVSEAKQLVQHTYQSSGHEGLIEWANAAPGVDAVEVTRR